MNTDEAMKLMFLIQTEYGEDKFVLSEERAKVWSIAMGHVSFDEGSAAFALYLRNGPPFPPRPGDLMQQVAVAVTDDVVAEAAWEEVLREVARVGLNPLPYWAGGVHHPAPVRTFSSPLIEAAVEATGWREICTTDKLGVQQAAFNKALKALMDRHQRNVRNHGPEQANLMLAESRDRVRQYGPGMVSAGEVIHALEERSNNTRHVPDDRHPANHHDPREGHRLPGHVAGDTSGPDLGAGSDWVHPFDVRFRFSKRLSGPESDGKEE